MDSSRQDEQDGQSRFSNIHFCSSLKTKIRKTCFSDWTACLRKVFFNTSPPILDLHLKQADQWIRIVKADFWISCFSNLKSKILNSCFSMFLLQFWIYIEKSTPVDLSHQDGQNRFSNFIFLVWNPNLEKHVFQYFHLIFVLIRKEVHPWIRPVKTNKMLIKYINVPKGLILIN